MKYLLVTTEYPPFFGGVANYYRNIVEHWPGAGSNPIIVLDNSQNKLISRYWRWLPSFWQICKKIKNNEADYILAGQLLPIGTVAWIINIIFHTPYSVFLHGMDLSFAMKSGRKKWLAKNILKKSCKIICSNTYVGKLAVEMAEALPEKIVIVNPGFDRLQSCEKEKDELKEKYNLQNKLIVFSLGRLVRRKGFDRLLETVPDVSSKINNVLYVIAGTGPDEKYLQQKLANLSSDIQSKIIFVGKISDEEKSAWLSICDVFAMPAREIDGDFEGFGIVYLEANSFGKPVVAGESGGVGDAVKNGLNGLMVNPNDKNDIACALLTLLQDKTRRDKIGQAGRDFVLKEFDWRQQVLIIYESLK